MHRHRPRRSGHDHVDHDVAAFDERAPTYESGWNGRMHVDIARRTADVALAAAPDATRVLDVGCGTGLVLRQLADRLPGAEALVGIDPAAGMVEVARARAARPEARSPGGGAERLRFDSGSAEALPYADGSFDLVVSAVSLHHWKDQRAGLQECARVLTTDGTLVLTDVTTRWRLPRTTRGRHGSRTRGQLTELLGEAGFRPVRWHRLYAFVVSTVVAVR